MKYFFQFRKILSILMVSVFFFGGMTPVVAATIDPIDGDLNHSKKQHAILEKTEDETELEPSQQEQASAPIRIMPLGDSLTKGTGPDTCFDPEPYLNCTGYRPELWNLLKDVGYSINFVGSQGGAYQDQYTHDNDHEGHGGKTTSYIRDNLYQDGANWLTLNPADIILLHIGTNDINNEKNSPSDIAGVIDQILNRVDQYESQKDVEILVVLARIINRRENKSAAGLRTTQLNQEIQKIADLRIAAGDKLIVVDMEAALDYPNDFPSEDVELLGLHPLKSGYDKMTNVWFEALSDYFGNQRPSIVDPGDQTTTEGKSALLQIQADDPDGDTLSYAASGLPAGLDIDSSSGEISGIVEVGASSGSPYAVEIKVTDNSSWSLSRTVKFQWTVNRNQAPAFVNPPTDQINIEGASVLLDLDANDPDGDQLTFTASGLPDSLSIDPESGEIAGTISIGAAALSTYSVIVTVTDDGSPMMSDTIYFQWTIELPPPKLVFIPMIRR